MKIASCWCNLPGIQRDDVIHVEGIIYHLIIRLISITNQLPNGTNGGCVKWMRNYAEIKNNIFMEIHQDKDKNDV